MEIGRTALTVREAIKRMPQFTRNPRYKLTLVNVGGGCRCPFSASVFVHLPVEPDGSVRITGQLLEELRVNLGLDFHAHQ